jgi:hypothetical protein
LLAVIDAQVVSFGIYDGISPEGIGFYDVYAVQRLNSFSQHLVVLQIEQTSSGPGNLTQKDPNMINVDLPVN